MSELMTAEASAPEQTISNGVAMALSAALEKIAEYVPTQWVDNTEPDIDAEHLNHAEQAIKRVTDLMNGAVDVITELQNEVTELNANFDSQKFIHPFSGTYIEATAPFNTIYAFREDGIITILSIIEFNSLVPNVTEYFHSNGVNIMQLLNTRENFGRGFSGGYRLWNSDDTYDVSRTLQFSYDATNNIFNLCSDKSGFIRMEATYYITVEQQ